MSLSSYKVLLVTHTHRFVFQHTSISTTKLMQLDTFSFIQMKSVFTPQKKNATYMLINIPFYYLFK